MLNDGQRTAVKRSETVVLMLEADTVMIFSHCCRYKYWTVNLIRHDTVHEDLNE